MKNLIVGLLGFAAGAGLMWAVGAPVWGITLGGWLVAFWWTQPSGDHP